MAKTLEGKMIEVSQLSEQFDVNGLQKSDADKVYQLELTNPQYFVHCPPVPSISSVIDDMHALPPGKTASDKYYVGFYAEDSLVAILDLILHYPDEQTAYIGLFMVDKAYQGRGVGSLIIDGCLACLKETGFTRARLGYMKGNEQSRNFWLKNLFVETGEEKINDRGVVIMMERKLM